MPDVLDRYTQLIDKYELVLEDRRKLRAALEACERHMTERGVSHEYPVMINARKALRDSLEISARGNTRQED